MSSYNGELTLTVNQCGSAADRQQILSFLGDVDAELPGEGLPAASFGALGVG
jgi:predicted aconitase with swiveling domain